MVIAKKLAIPHLVVFDADGNVENVGRRNLHKLDNTKVIRLLDGDPNEPFPAVTVWADRFVLWPVNLTTTLKAEVGPSLWETSYSAATKGLGNPEGSFLKNTIHIGEHLTILRSNGGKLPTLDRLCELIVALT